MLHVCEGLFRIKGATSKMAHLHGCLPQVSLLHYMDLSMGLLECPHMAEGSCFRVSGPRKRKAEATISSMTWTHRSYAIISNLFYALEVSHEVQYTFRGKRIRLHILNGVSNECISNHHTFFSFFLFSPFFLFSLFLLPLPLLSVLSLSSSPKIIF